MRGPSIGFAVGIVADAEEVVDPLPFFKIKEITDAVEQLRQGTLRREFGPP